LRDAALRCELIGSVEIAALTSVFIPKANGILRPLGISTLRDRVCVTAAMLLVLIITTGNVRLTPWQDLCGPVQDLTT
jgi:retron-type reverse transcriptase